MSARDFPLPKLLPPRSAAPGWFVLEAVCDDTGYPIEAHQEPVISWCHDEELFVPYPVIDEGPQTHSLFMLRPDGSVSQAFSKWFPSVDAWLRDQQQAHQESAGKAVQP